MNWAGEQHGIQMQCVGSIETNGINPLLRSLGADFSQATDVYVVSALRNLPTFFLRERNASVVVIYAESAVEVACV